MSSNYLNERQSERTPTGVAAPRLVRFSSRFWEWLGHSPVALHIAGICLLLSVAGNTWLALRRADRDDRLRREVSVYLNAQAYQGHDRKEMLPASFMDNTDPAPIAKKLRAILDSENVKEHAPSPAGVPAGTEVKP